MQYEEHVRRQSVCAVIVTYHPNVAMLENLRNVLGEVQGLVVVDNSSSAHELDALKTASRGFGFHLIENGDNLGIAEALNQGVRWAISREFPWVLLLDQDSRMRDGFIEAMFRTWISHPKREELATIHPRYMHPELGCRPLALRSRDGSLLWCLTSGALMPTWIFDKIGCFASEFFIDWVDIEYCFRIRKAGYLIAESSGAILLHEPGHSAPSSILGLRFWPSHHSAARRYYMSRNRIVVFRKYFFSLPICTLKLMFAALRDTAKCFLGEKQRPQKFRSFLLGTWDGLTGRMGMRESL
jgi:rhamnosyltransferase